MATDKNLETALALAVSDHPTAKRIYKRTTSRTITRRGVIWLGQTCNLRCQFCYFIDRVKSEKHPQHPFMSLAKAKEICNTLVTVYDNNAVDVQGGEPTIYKDIFDLISYCKEIGLQPTLITNALVLDNEEQCVKFKKAGIYDFLISVHGLGDIHNQMVGNRDAHVRQMRALKNLQEVGIPFRLNCVLSKLVVPQLPAIAELGVKVGALAVNFIVFNPFADQSQKGKRSVANVPRYTDLQKNLSIALDILDRADIEANVRYLPLCILEDRYRRYVYNFQQLSYDHHEWDYASWAWTGLEPQRTRQGGLSEPLRPSTNRWLLYLKRPAKHLGNFFSINRFLYKAHRLFAAMSSGDKRPKESVYRKIAKMHAEIHCNYIYGKVCSGCIGKDICDGFHGDYAQFFGIGEARPIKGDKKIEDPAFFIRQQQKYVNSVE